MTLEEIFQDVLLPVIIAGATCYFIERTNAVNKKIKFLKNEFGQDMSFFLFNASFLIPLSNFILLPVINDFLYPYFPYQFFDQHIRALPFMVQILLGVLILDFIIYWRHRFTHVFMWRFHSIHHNALEMSWSTKLRLHPVDFLVAILFNIVFLFFIGFSGEAIVISSAIITIVDYWNHCNFKFGFKSFLRYFFSTPQYHHWHHAAARAAMDKNFVVCFPFYDLIFGSYYYPVDQYPDKYGLSESEQEKVPQGILGQFLLPFKRKN